MTGQLSHETAIKVDATTSGFFWLLAIVPGLWFLAEVVTMLTNEKRRALHDYIAGTVVVRTNIWKAQDPSVG